MTSHEAIPTAQRGRFDAATWIVAATLVLGAHAGLIAGYSLLRPLQPLGAQDIPAVIIDLAPMTVAPAAQSQDLTPGPQIPPPPQPAEPPKQEVTKPNLEPDAQPKIESPAALNPQVTLPNSTIESTPLDKPKPVDHSIEAKPIPPPRPQTAPPAAKGVAPVAAAARPGVSKGKTLPASWVQKLLAHLNHYKRYPREASLRHEDGVVVLSFTMDRNGHVLARHIARSSGSAELDAEVLKMLRRADPLPQLPLNVTGSTRSFNVPIRFALR